MGNWKNNRMIKISHLHKEYKGLTAVKDLSLHLEAGDIFGFIGPNGAGKTTTIKMLATLLKPTSGTALIDGIDVVENPEAVRGRIGYMPAFFGIYDDMRVWEYLDFFAGAYRLPRAQRPRIIDDVLNLTDLIGKKDNYVEELSTGMKQRLCLAKTLIHDPQGPAPGRAGVRPGPARPHRDQGAVQGAEGDGKDHHHLLAHPARACRLL